MSITGFRSQLLPHVERGTVPAVLAVRSGRSGHEVFTASAPAGNRLELDSLVRIGSLTKPIVATATLVLAERGVFALDDAVDRYLPELADRRVLRRLDGPLDDVEPARHEITVRHLLTCTMGFGFPMTRGPHPILDAAAALGVAPGPPKPRTHLSPEHWLGRFASLPLMAEPGTAWMYDTSYSVLGVLLGRVCAAPLEDVLRELVFDPLRMIDSGFFVPTARRHRLVPCALAGDERQFDGAIDSQWTTPPPFPDAAGGLISTADDFLRFGHMLLAGGVLDGRRVLGESSVALMTSNHIQDGHRGPASGPFLEQRGWGLGVAVAVSHGDPWSRPGRYGWDGGFGTSWFNDAHAGDVALLVTQRFPPAFEVFAAFWEASGRPSGEPSSAGG